MRGDSGMKKLFIILSIIVFSLSIFAESRIKLQEDKYDLSFENITKIEKVDHNSEKELRVKGEEITIKIEKNQIAIKSKKKSVINSISFPRNVEFRLVRKDQIMTFKDNSLVVKTEKEDKIIEIKKDRILVKDGADTVRIDEDGIFIDSADGEHVRLGKNGLMVKDNDEETDLGFFGRLIGNIAGKIANFAVRQSVNYNNILNNKLNNFVSDENLLDPDDLNIDIDREDIDEIKKKAEDVKEEVPQIENYVYRNINELDLKLVSSDYVIKKSDTENVKIKIIKNKFPQNNYKINIKQDNKKLEIEEKLKASFSRLDVKFIINVPRNISLNIDTTSADGTVNGIEKINKLNIISTSGDVSLYNLKKIDTTIIKVVSGDLNLTSLTGKNLNITTTSGDSIIKDVELSNLGIKVTSGDIKINNSIINKFDYKSISGDLEGKDCNINTLEADTTSGDIDFESSKIKSKVFKSISGDFNISRLLKFTKVVL